MDGEDNNRSWNCGVEGPTDDEAINKLRKQQMQKFPDNIISFTGCTDA